MTLRRHDILLSLTKLLLRPWFVTVIVIVEMLIVILALITIALAITAVLILVEGLTSVFIVFGLIFVIMLTLLSRRPARTF